MAKYLNSRSTLYNQFGWLESVDRERGVEHGERQHLETGDHALTLKIKRVIGGYLTCLSQNIAWNLFCSRDLVERVLGAHTYFCSTPSY